VSSAFIYGPEALRLVPNLKQAVLGIVALAACRTSEVPAPASAPPIIGFVYNKSCTAAARNHKHPWPVFGFDNGWFLNARAFP